VAGERFTGFIQVYDRCELLSEVIDALLRREREVGTDVSKGCGEVVSFLWVLHVDGRGAEHRKAMFPWDLVIKVVGGE
jgi:hypothetical protein